MLKMVIDGHYHLEERLETVERLLTQMDRHGIVRIALVPAVQDPFRLGAAAYKALKLMRAALMSRWQGLGLLLYRSLVASNGKFVVMGKRCSIYDQPDNRTVSRVIQAHPDRFYGWIFVNPRAADPIQEMNKWMGQPGWVGVKTHPFMHRYPVAMLDEVAAYCVNKDVPLLMHLGGDRERGDYRYLPERHPGLRVIYAHGGLPFYRELWDYARRKENVLVDISSPYLDEPLRFGTITALGSRKCLYGTDGPYGYADSDGSYDHGKILGEILRSPLRDIDKERITGGNFSEIIGSRRK